MSHFALGHSVCVFPSCLPHRGAKNQYRQFVTWMPSNGRMQSQMSQEQIRSKNHVDLTPGSKVTAEAMPANPFFYSDALYCSTTHFFTTHLVQVTFLNWLTCF